MPRNYPPLAGFWPRLKGGINSWGYKIQGIQKGSKICSFPLRNPYLWDSKSPKIRLRQATRDQGSIADFLGVYSVYSVKSKYMIYSDLEGGGWPCIITISVTAVTSADGKIMVIIHGKDTDASLGGAGMTMEAADTARRNLLFSRAD